ncbi:UTRA domain-containing protein [Hyphococcus flavus]|uniref:UTRA domain-containing protein n=1 Tax=Hyphococcus flavus TaxID=1866326 RepID=A0AAF0CEU9_9PROT|nr:UTRA domain-containing protein [Hyphococcus flavus]WDI30118.1 UTRA domain-containing protein [Hyphococcus flavus]
MTLHTHQSLKSDIMQRIAAGEWRPGAVMPNEAQLAEEYGCARSTINRALQTLAEDGLIERKRRAGTRVRELPVRQAKFKIPLVRREVEETGGAYHSHVILKDVLEAPNHVAARLRLSPASSVLHLQTVHLCNDNPFAFEDRWVNIEAAPDILDAPFDRVSANEWLLRQTPYSNGDVSFSAEKAGEMQASALGISSGDALFTIDRTTWFGEQFITWVKLYYRPGYSLKSNL